MSYRVAVVGATGAVGVEILNVLADKKFPVSDLKLFASERSAGKTMRFKGKDYEVRDVAKGGYEGVDFAFFSAGAERSRMYVPKFVEAGAVVIDNSSAFRMEPSVPLVVPEVNPHTAAEHKGVIANPNCSTIIALVALWPLHQEAVIERFTVATYQAVSGAGAAAMAELEAQLAALIENPGAQITPEEFPHRIAYNVIPQVDVPTGNGYYKEEMKFVNETRKIFGDDKIRVSATCVRVPVLRAHSEAIHLETRRKLSVERARELLSKAPNLTLMDNYGESIYPMPIHASGKYGVYAGRLRADVSHPNGLALWVCGDQLLKGAAENAVQIAELLV